MYSINLSAFFLVFLSITSMAFPLSPVASSDGNELNVRQSKTVLADGP